MKILTHEGLQYFYNQIAAKFSTKEQTAEAIEEAVGNAGVGTVTSVNGKTGVVQLSASDVGALPASTQIPSIAGLATETYVDNKVASMVDSAPETLNTLNELAAALGDDPNFATTVATEIGGKVSKSGDTMTGRLKLTSSDGYPTLAFHAVGSDSYAAAIQTATSAGRMTFVERATDTNYFESFQLPTPSTGLTESKYHNIITSKGGTINGSLIINANSLFVRNNVPMVNLQNADGSETMGALSGVANGSGSNYTVRLAARGKGTSFYEYYSTPYAANNLTANKYYDLLTTRSAVTIAQGGTGATTAEAALTNLGALPLSGGTLTGALSLASGLYAEGDTLDATQYALDMNNSNIIGANGIYMNDASDGITEGIHFYRSSTAYDSIWAANGKLYFTPNRPLNSAGTAYTVYHTGNKPTAADVNAVSKTGDTMTGPLTATQLNASIGNGYNIMTADRNGKTTFLLQQDVASSRVQLMQIHPNSTFAERYRLPYANAEATADTNYDILTSRNPVTIAQGGTGATEKGVACRNLMNGVNIEPASIELYPSSNKVNHGGFIDFHYNGSTSDHTSRIIESASGELTMNNYCKLFNSGRQMQLTGTTSGDTTYARFIASTSSGSVALQSSTNWGVYDITGGRWLIHVNKSGDSSNVNIAAWASLGSSTQPVYFNNKGRPVACGAIAIANGGTGATNEVTAANNLKIQSLGHGTDIPKNANLNTYTTVGNYRCGSTSTGATITNCPVANAFTLQVYAATGTSTSAPTTAGWAYFLQKLTTIDGAQYYRTITFSNSTTASFGDWIEIYDSANKPTAADVGALALTGGTVSGAVTINNTLTATKVIGAVYA